MRLEIYTGDITCLNLDAVVNAANTTLLGGGGVDGAIHRAAGPQLLEECRKLGGCPTGEARITSGYRLAAKYVIHTVGPVWRGGAYRERELLKACYLRALECAREHRVRTLAFPCISTGVYRFPKQEAAAIAVTTVKDFLSGCPEIEKVVFACFSEADAEIYRKWLTPLTSEDASGT